MGLKSSLNSAFSKNGVLRATFDIRVFFFIGGLSLFGYGLYLYIPLVSYIACGFILMAVGWLMEDKS